MHAVNWLVYVQLSAVFFLEFAVWGAWMPVLAARLLGPLKFNGKQTGWIYATLPLASLIAIPLAGHVADKYCDLAWIMVACHAAGAILLWLASRTEKFGPLFVVMFLYCLCYAATLPLANGLVMGHQKETLVAEAVILPLIFVWGNLGWALAGYVLAGLRHRSITKADGADALKLAALLSVGAAIVCALAPASRPENTGGTPILEAFSLLREPNFLLLFVVTLLLAGTTSFYFQGTAQFLQDIGISAKNVPAVMSVGQATQAVGTAVLLGLFYFHWLGPKWTLVVGAGCWLLMYVIFVGSRQRWLIIPAQGLHGLAYLFALNAAWLFAGQSAPEAIRNSVQSLINLAMIGVGPFLGTQAAGIVMDRFSVAGRFQWRKIFAVPLVCTLLGVIVYAAALRDPQKPAGEKAPAKAVAAAAAGATR